MSSISRWVIDMAAAGSSVSRTYRVDLSPDAAIQWSLQAVNGVDRATASQAGPNALTVTRKYIPTWAIVVAVIGALLFLIGLLALLYRETETLTITARDNGDGSTTVYVSGMATDLMVQRLDATFAESLVE